VCPGLGCGRRVAGHGRGRFAQVRAAGLMLMAALVDIRPGLCRPDSCMTRGI